MDVNRLSGEEVRYELEIRGMPLTGTLAQKRAILRDVLRLERVQEMIPPATTHYDAESELCLCRAKLFAVERDLRNVTAVNRVSEVKRLDTLLSHLHLRILRIHVVSDVERAMLQGIKLHEANLREQLDAENEVAHGNDKKIEDQQTPTANDLIVLGDCIEDISDQTCRNNQPVHDFRAPVGGVLSSTAEGGARRLVAAPMITVEEFSNVPIDIPPRAPTPPEEYVREMSGGNSPLSTQFGSRRYQPLFADDPLCEQHRVGDPEGEAVSRENLRRLDVHEKNSPSDPQRSTTQPTLSRTERLQTHSYELNEPPIVHQAQRSSLYRPDRENQFIEAQEREPMNFGPDGSRFPPRQSQVRFDRPVRPTAQGNSTLRAEDSNQTVTLDSLARLLEGLKYSPISHPPRESTFVDFRPFSNHWDVKYNGQSSVGDFLERVEELRVSRGLSKASLLRAAPELFTGDALLWYRTQRFVSWDDLTYQLRDAFQPYDYEDSLWDEIRRRTQGSQERVFSYIVAMENLFRKLREIPSAETKLHIVRRNLLPYLQSRLAVHNISSLAELLRLGRAIEETEVRIQRFAPPPTNRRQLLEPELAYQKPQHHSTAPIVSGYRSGVDSHESLPTFQLNDNLEAASLETSDQIAGGKCWNCGQAGHRFRQCKEQKRLFCYRCGEKQVTIKSCTKCQKNDRPTRT